MISDVIAAQPDYGADVANLTVRAATPTDLPAVQRVLTNSWGMPMVVGHGVQYDLTTLPAFVAERDGVLAGVLTYSIDNDQLEIVSIDAVSPGEGVGTALLAAAVADARRRGLRRVWLITTNDNLDALRFYQRRGLRLVGVRPGAVDLARQIKPSIPETGSYGIPIHDELTLELRLDTEDPYRHPVQAGRAAFLQRFRWCEGHADTWALLRDPIATSDVVRGLAYPFLGAVDVVVATEARGFSLGCLVARELGVAFVPIRKAEGALPGEKLQIEAAPNWRGRRHTLRIQRAGITPGHRVLLVDDWVETGASLHGAWELVSRCGGRLTGVALLVDQMPDALRGELERAGVRVGALVNSGELPPAL